MKTRNMLVYGILSVLVLPASWARGAEKKVALLPFENRASATSLSFVTHLSAILMDSLRGTGRIEVIGSTQVGQAMHDLTITPGEPLSGSPGVKIGAWVGADWLIQGSVLESYQIAARCLDARTGKPVLDQTVTGRKDDIIDLVDALGKRLMTGLGGGAAHKVAVLPFINRASDEYLPFVRGISDMLVTGLEASRALTFIERTAIRQVIQKFQLGAGEALDPTTIVEAGSDLGVDLIIQGSFLEVYQLDTQLIDVREAKVLGRSSVKGERSEITAMAGQLARQLLEGVTRRVAVLDFENRASDQYQAVVRALADTLRFRVGQTEQVTAIDRSQIETALQHATVVGEGPTTPEQAVQVGEWLGADAIVLGSFTKFGRTVLIDAQLIDVKTGELLVGQHIKGEEEAVGKMLDEMGRSLVEGFLGKAVELTGQTGRLEIIFRIEATSMTERRIFHHLCRMYLDGRLMGESPVVKMEDGWTTIFSQALRAGSHTIEVVHGYVGKKDHTWVGKLDNQPEVFHVDIEPNVTTTIQYAYKVGWFSDEYTYKEGAGQWRR